MTLFIACLLIYMLQLHWAWYIAAVVLWGGHLFVYYHTMKHLKEQIAK